MWKLAHTSFIPMLLRDSGNDILNDRRGNDSVFAGTGGDRFWQHRPI
ncbi:hypothetical protein ACE1CB_00305 [Aerosakkonema sp. BLCC-F2]